MRRGARVRYAWGYRSRQSCRRSVPWQERGCRRLAGLLALGVVCLLLGGCFDAEYEVSLRADGGGTLRAALVTHPAMGPGFEGVTFGAGWKMRAVVRGERFYHEGTHGFNSLTDITLEGESIRLTVRDTAQGRDALVEHTVRLSKGDPGAAVLLAGRTLTYRLETPGPVTGAQPAVISRVEVEPTATGRTVTWRVPLDLLVRSSGELIAFRAAFRDEAGSLRAAASKGRGSAGDAPSPREERHATARRADTPRLAGRWEGKTSRGDSFVWKIRDDGSIEVDGKKGAGSITMSGASIQWSYSQSELARGALTWLAGSEGGRLAGTFEGSALTFELDYRPHAIVLAVPGIDFWQTLLPGDHAQPWKSPTYLQESVAAYFDANRIPVTVVPFTRWQDLDISRTREAVQELVPVLLALADRARREGESLHVVAHSWGAVLMYLALSEIAAGGTTQGVHLDGLFTLGTQIGWLPYLSPGRLCLAGVLDVNLVEAAVKKALCRYAEPHAGLPLTNPGNAIRNWVNFYSTADSFSRDVPSPPAAKSTDVGRVGGLIQDHRQYYAWNHGGWTYDAELIRNRARAVLGEVALEIQLALRALRQAGPRPVAIRPAGLAVEPATRWGTP